MRTMPELGTESDIEKAAMTKKMAKQNAAHEPECIHVKHFCETNYLNSLVHVSPVTVAVHCRLWNMEGGGVQSVEREESGVLSGKSNM